MDRQSRWLKIKRVYVRPDAADGMRVLVDGLWPRGLSKAQAGVDLWLKDLAPSAELRRWFDHDAGKWEAFQSKYAVELDARPEAVQRLLSLAEESTLTLLYAAREEQYNNAVALQAYLERKAAAPPDHAPPPT